MNKKYKKILATGLALNMMLVNIPYNVFANCDMIENIMLNEDNLPLIGEQDKSDLLIESEQTLNDEDLIIYESNSSNVSNETAPELPEPIIKEDYSSVTENNISENVSNSVTNFVEDENIVKSIIPSVTNYADSFAGGDGSEENPYQISNALELARLTYLVNEECLDTTGMYFELISDIDLSDFDSDNDESNGNWIPIGINSDNCFKGDFNGSNYKISNLNINKSYSYSGLFGATENVVVKNLQIDDCNLNNVYYGGLIVGYAYGSIEITNIKGVNNSIVNTGLGYATIGGLVGYINYYRYDSSHFVDIEDVELEVNVSFVDCSGSYVGGIIGNTYSFNNIKMTNIDIDFTLNGESGSIGGLVGECVVSQINTDEPLIIKNISVNMSYTGSGKNSYTVSDTGGLIGDMTSSNKIIIDIEDIDIYMENKNSKIITSSFGGLIGETSRTTLNILNVDIKGLNDINTYQSGGLIGDSYDSSIVADNIFVNLDIFAMHYGGGLIGEITFSDYIYIDNFNYNGKIVGTDTDRNYRYGGVIADISSIKNVEILNSNINATIEFECMNYSGGLIGSVSNSNILLKNNIVNIGISNCKYQNGGLIGYVYIDDGSSVEIEQNEIYLNIVSNKYDSSKIGGIIGQIYNKGNLNVKDNFVVGNIDGISNDRGYFSSIIDNSGEMSVSNIYFVSNIDRENHITERDTYLYSELNGNKITLSNIYYNSDISSLPDNTATPLKTEQMQGINAKENMPFDYDDIWKLNKEYYPTFEQLNTAPELSGNDIELVQNQEYNLLDYVTVEDFEDKDLVSEVVTDLDITKIGNYTATFTVVDPGGLSDELTLNIKVVAEKPIINAKDLTLYIGDKFNPLNKVTAIDINGNDITEHIKVIENTVDTTKKGVYKVVYQVDSLERLSTTKEIKVTVLEKEVSNNNSNNTNDNKVEDNKNESSTTDKPQTGDNFMGYEISLLASLGGLLYANRKSKKED